MVVPKADGESGRRPALGALDDGRLRWVDPLHGIPLARYFDRRLSEELSRSARFTRPTSIVLVQVGFDRGLVGLAQFNAGHALGIMVASIIRSTCREFDVVCRRDEDELGIILPETGQAGAAAFTTRIAEMISRALSQCGAEVGGKTPTLSFGTATSRRGEQTPFELVLAAEEALLRSRRRCAGVEKAA
ncbi:MAG: GGDEF domain-containing protein [Myxococcales bacterium]|nr:GGDEF domain-containing protein [Myxococcales bacterium]